MKADDLEFLELIAIEDGNINLKGRRLVLHSIHAFSQFRKDIVDMLGHEHARRLFTRFGYFWGQADAAALQRVFRWPNVEEWIRAGVRLQALEGVVQASVTELVVDHKLGRFHMEVSWHDSVEVEEHLMETDPGSHTVCWKLVGYTSGYVSYCLNRSVYFIETQCQGRQDPFCQGVGKDYDSWGEEIRPYLPYFEAEDIKGTVRKLTRELREKTQVLRRHKRELNMLHHKSVPYFVEGRSKIMQDVLDLASRVAEFDSSVLITGETGTGKEVLAKYIHETSQRAKGPFVAVNCGALPETLLDSELFGHKAGSFTGAVRDRTGLFEEASKGTMFLDEIGDISPATQLRILRVLQEKEILRVGENIPRRIDVRVIAATNKDLSVAVGQGKFREDLLYRLKVIEIEMPSLRMRPEDILPLARFLVKRIAARLGIRSLRLDTTCSECLTAYEWPGNVRELENVLERSAVICDEGIILPEHMPVLITCPVERQAQAVSETGASLKQIEMAHIRRVLELTGGNRTRAAKILGIGQVTLWRKLKDRGT